MAGAGSGWTSTAPARGSGARPSTSPGGFPPGRRRGKAGPPSPPEGAGRLSAHFQELDYRRTPIGELSLRRRREPALGIDVLEIKLGDEFLMSSHFTASEVELGRLGVAECAGADCAGPGLAVVVGGLGLGSTATAG